MHPVLTPRAPLPIGPYSQAVVCGDLVFCSGQVGIDPDTGAMVSDDVAAQARQVLTNLAAVLAEAGSGLEQVVKTTVYVTDLSDFGVVNGIYAEAFGPWSPARATVEVSRLPAGARVEIDAIAHQGRDQAPTGLEESSANR